MTAQIAQIAGALMILAAFVLAQFRVLDPHSWWYLGSTSPAPGC